VEFPVTLPSSPDWRRAALAAAVLAAVELVVLVILAVGAFGLPFAEERRREALASSGAQTGHRDSGVASADSGRKGVPTPRQTRSETSVVVLNGNGITGAADLAAAPVRKQQYILTATGNAPRSDFRRTLVMYRPGFEGEAHRLARDVGAERVAPLDGLRGADLLGAQLALIVGRK
jgi:LytR cell envelope-related transcriptional attenuator